MHTSMYGQMSTCIKLTTTPTLVTTGIHPGNIETIHVALYSACTEMYAYTYIYHWYTLASYVTQCSYGQASSPSSGTSPTLLALERAGSRV